MKNKEGFNPRINKSNIYKMTPEELDQYNKKLEEELKNTKRKHISQQIPKKRIKY